MPIPIKISIAKFYANCRVKFRVKRQEIEGSRKNCGSSSLKRAKSDAVAISQSLRNPFSPCVLWMLLIQLLLSSSNVLDGLLCLDLVDV